MPAAITRCLQSADRSPSRLDRSIPRSLHHELEFLGEADRNHLLLGWLNVTRPQPGSVAVRTDSSSFSLGDDSYGGTVLDLLVHGFIHHPHAAVANLSNHPIRADSFWLHTTSAGRGAHTHTR